MFVESPFRHQRELSEPRHSFPLSLKLRGSLCHGSRWHLRNFFRIPSVGRSHAFRIVDRLLCQYNTASLPSVVSSLLLQRSIGTPLTLYGFPMYCIICNGYIPSQCRDTIDVLPPDATFNHIYCDNILRLIEVLSSASTP